MKNAVKIQTPKKYGKAENDLAREQAADIVDELPVMPRALVGIALGCIENLESYISEGKIGMEYTCELFWMSCQLERMCDYFGASDDGWGHYEERDNPSAS